MKKSAKGTNRRRALYELAPDQLQLVNKLKPGLGDSLNDRFKRIGEHLEATAGLRGQVSLASQLHMDSNPVKGVSDPVDGEDLVNLRTLKRYRECQRVLSVLEECNDYDDLLSNESVEQEGISSILENNYFWGYTVRTPDTSSSDGIGSSGHLFGWGFVLPWAITVRKMTLQITGGSNGFNTSYGLYDSSRNLVVYSGVINSTTGVKQVSVTETTLEPGFYWLACVTAGLLHMVVGSTSTAQAFPVLRATSDRVGTAGAVAVGGALPSTLPTLTNTVGVRPPGVLFES